MLLEMTDEEWHGWLWYMQHEPFGAPVEDLRHGMLCAVSIAPHLKKGAKADPRNYMVCQPPPRELTPEETVAFFRANLGGRVRDS